MRRAVFASIAAVLLSACAGVQPRLAAPPELVSLPSVSAASPPAGAAVACPLPSPSPEPEAESSEVAPVLPAAAQAPLPEAPLAAQPAPREVAEAVRPPAGVGARSVALLLPVPPAPPAARAGPVAAPAVTAARPAAPSSATSAGSTRVREIYARVGDTIEIGLDGLGFLFLGLPDRQIDGMSFTARQVADGKTSFSFKALKLGDYDLDFQQQDNSSGRSTIESVLVHVVSDAEFETAIRQSPTVPVAAGGLPPQRATSAEDLAYADRLAAIGKPAAAIAELMKGYREGNPELNDRLAGLYRSTADLDAAEKYWMMNVGAAAPWGDRAVVGLARLAVARRDMDGWVGLQRQVLAVTAQPIGDLLVDAAGLARERGDVGLGLDLLGEYGRRYPDGPRLDEVAFFSAQLLEADSPFRDLRKARDLYAALLEQYPESAHAGDALARVRWLDQHVFLVR